jgi:two-component system, NtrC family, response regulator HydG
MHTRILIIEDDEQLSSTFRRFLKGAGYEVDWAGDYAEGKKLLMGGKYGAVFLDINLNGRLSGIDLLREARECGIDSPVAIITGQPDVASASEAVRNGAFDYLCKPVEKDQLLRVARSAVHLKRVSDEKERYRKNLEAVFRSVRDAIITIDLNMTVTGLNEAADGICLFSRAVLGKKVADLAGECGGACLRAIDTSFRTGEMIDRGKIDCLRSGKRQVLAMRISPLLGHNGECEGAVIVIRDETLIESLERDLRKRRDFHNTLIGKSEKMQDIYDRIEILSDLPTTVLVGGESGVGKELAARALHYAGNRRNMPFIKVDCSALAENLLESELFGHVRGAFTGAIKNKKGRFEMAAGGTIFLDEIGDISPAIQQRLLRVIQEKEFERVGDATPIKVDVRIVAATNKNMKGLVASGVFREDLYYRLKVVEIGMPPLRERREDIQLLTDFFLAEYNQEFGKNIQGISPDVMRGFMEYSWPGNVRELRHTIEHAAILCKHAIISLDDLPPELRKVQSATVYLPAEITTSEASIILQTLRDAKWHKTEVARILGISRQTLYRKLKALGIED